MESGRDWIFEPNGTGPFKLAEYVPGEILRLERFDGYHLGPAMIDGVEFLISGGNSMLMYENDELHITGIPLGLLEGVLDQANALSSEVVAAPPNSTSNTLASTQLNPRSTTSKSDRRSTTPSTGRPWPAPCSRTW